MPQIYPAKDAGIRFDERAWLRYYPIICAWLPKADEVFTFRPTKLTPETVMVRIRDAVRGFFTYNWAPNDLDKELLRTKWEQAIISHDGTDVTIRPKHLGQDTLEIADLDQFLFTVTNPTKPELIAICVLANAGHFNNKRVNIIQLSDDLIPFINGDEIRNSFGNIIIQSQERKQYTIL